MRKKTQREYIQRKKCKYWKKEIQGKKNMVRKMKCKNQKETTVWESKWKYRRKKERKKGKCVERLQFKNNERK